MGNIIGLLFDQDALFSIVARLELGSLVSLAQRILNALTSIYEMLSESCQHNS